MMFTPFSLLFLWRVFAPREFEFVVADGVMRWGRTDRPSRQSKLPLSEVVRLFINEDNGSVEAHTRRGFTYVAHNLIFGLDDLRALAAFVREHHPGVIVQ